MRVFKFGGASVRDASSVRNVHQIIDRFNTEPLIIVVSAMGKTTNKFEALVNAHLQKNQQKPFWKTSEIATEILPENCLEIRRSP